MVILSNVSLTCDRTLNRRSSQCKLVRLRKHSLKPRIAALKAVLLNFLKQVVRDGVQVLFAHLLVDGEVDRLNLLNEP